MTYAEKLKDQLVRELGEQDNVGTLTEFACERQRLGLIPADSVECPTCYATQRIRSTEGTVDA